MMSKHNDDLIKEQQLSLKHENMKRTLLIFAASFANANISNEKIPRGVFRLQAPESCQKHPGF